MTFGELFESEPSHPYQKLVCTIDPQVPISCAICGNRTSWILISRHTATCSAKCLEKQITQTISPGHWLTNRE